MHKYICTNCRAIYEPTLGDEDSGIEPGTLFEEIDENWCCPICLSPKDIFLELPDIVHEASHENLMNDTEFSHTPRYFIEDDKIIVRIADENGYPNEPDHRIVFVGLYDEDGEILELRKTNIEEFEDWFIFDLPDEEFSIRASCNIHGIWKGILDDDLGEDYKKEKEAYITQ